METTEPGLARAAGDSSPGCPLSPNSLVCAPCVWTCMALCGATVCVYVRERVLVCALRERVFVCVYVCMRARLHVCVFVYVSVRCGGPFVCVCFRVCVRKSVYLREGPHFVCQCGSKLYSLLPPLSLVKIWLPLSPRKWKVLSMAQWSMAKCFLFPRLFALPSSPYSGCFCVALVDLAISPPGKWFSNGENKSDWQWEWIWKGLVSNSASGHLVSWS